MTNEKYNMLIADDIAMSREMIASNMQDKFQIYQASNGIQAMNIMLKQKIDILILDIVMPKMDGVEVLRNMKRIDTLSLIPVIVVTVTEDADREREVLELGADEIIRKPFDSELLKKRVHNIMTLRFAKQAEEVRRRLQSVLDESGGSIFRIKYPGKVEADHAVIEYINREYFQIRGYEPEDLLGTEFSTHTGILDEDYAETIRVLKKVTEEKRKRVTYSYRVRNTAGEIRYLNCVASITYREREVVMDIIETDVTEHRILQDRVTNLEWENQENQRLLNAILDNFPGGVSIFEISAKDDAEQVVRIKFFNSSVAKLFGYTPEEYRKVIQDNGLAGVHPDDIDKVELEINKSIQFDNKFECSFRNRRKDGQYIWIKLTAQVMEKTDSLVIGYGSYSDIDSLMEQTQTDALTGIFNRHAFENKVKADLKRMAEKMEPKAMMLIDIDNFKKVNDTYGHFYGDEVLMKVAKLMEMEFREKDYVARIGGDEFCVYISDCIPDKVVMERASILRRKLNMTFCEDFQTVTISGSIGVAFTGRDGTSYEELYKKADEAQYFAKKNGKNCYCIAGEDKTRI